MRGVDYGRIEALGFRMYYLDLWGVGANYAAWALETLHVQSLGVRKNPHNECRV